MCESILLECFKTTLPEETISLVVPVVRDLLENMNTLYGKIRDLESELSFLQREGSQVVGVRIRQV